jgi:hypothetical protein
MINTINFHLKKDNRNKKNSDFYYFVSENKLGLRVESIIFVISGIAFYVYSNFNVVMSIPFILAVYNCFLIFFYIHKSVFEIKKNTISYQIEYGINKVFLELKMLCIAMKEKGLTEKELKKWKQYYIGRIMEFKSLNTINSVSEDIASHFYKITLIEFPMVKEKDVLKFIKKESKQWWDELYPNFANDLKNNAFSKQKTSKSQGGENKSVGSNYKLEQNLKILGLPTTTRNMNIVKKRYFELVKIYHPDSKENRDKDKQMIQEKIIEINGAFQEIQSILKQTEVS